MTAVISTGHQQAQTFSSVKSLSEADDDYIVLLFYHYVTIDDTETHHSTQLEVCRQLKLNGRIRISPEGINGTIGGARQGIQNYMQFMDSAKEYQSHQRIHWKIGGLVDRLDPIDQHLQNLSVKITKEVVSLDLHDEVREAVVAVGPGVHLPPQDFHAALYDILNQRKSESTKFSPKLIDIRNHYEIRIGKFEVVFEDGETLEASNPETRQFSDLRKYFDDHIEEYVGRKVFMYCTGGVRCERASAYLKYKGVEEVYQLSGGIHAYQETFPDGGFFRGKNFVFDPRLAVPSANRPDDVVGECCLCHQPWDDYSLQQRCSQCRMLVLVCNECHTTQAAGSTSDHPFTAPIVCEFCCANTKVDDA